MPVAGMRRCVPALRRLGNRLFRRFRRVPLSVAVTASTSSAAAAASAAGRWGEDIAARWLSQHGFKIIGRRVRPNRRDELDIVARRKGLLVFVEVKTRRDEHFGRPVSAVDARKRRSLCRAASAYLRRAHFPAGSYRFDVVEVIGQPGTRPVVRHIEDAFRFGTRYRFPVK